MCSESRGHRDPRKPAARPHELRRGPWCARGLAPFVFAVAATAPVLVPATARADAATDARDLFSRGRALRNAGDCANALALFQRASDLYPAGLGSLRNTAECEEALGRFADARRAWLDLRSALATRTDPKYEGWAEDAERAAQRLAPPLAMSTADVTPVAPSTPAPPATSRVVPGESTGARRWVAWTAIGVGAAALVGAGISWAVRQSAMNEISDACGGSFDCTKTPGTPALMQTKERGQTATTLAAVFTAVGAAAVAGGIVLLVTTPSRAAPPAAFVVSPFGASVIGRF